MGTPQPDPIRAALRSGVRVSVVSVTWTLIASSGAIVAGIVSRALVLVVFGLTGVLDAAGSFTLALHFRHALKHESVSVARERFALRVVSSGLIAIALFTLVESVHRLMADVRVRSALYGVVIAAASVVALTALTLRKRVVARKIPSTALWADSWLSATGAGLGFIALVGTALASRKHWAWIDPVTALIVALAAGAIGVGALRREEDDLLPPP